MTTNRDIQMRRYWHAADIMNDGINADESEPADDDPKLSHTRLDVDEYSLEFGGRKFIAFRHGEPWRDLTGDNLILAMMTRIIELQRIVASNRSDESEPTAEEWAIAEQRAGEAKMDDSVDQMKGGVE